MTTLFIVTVFTLFFWSAVCLLYALIKRHTEGVAAFLLASVSLFVYVLLIVQSANFYLWLGWL